jgi:hypothetical protein
MHSKVRVILLASALILLILIVNYLSTNWYYLPFFYDGYGRNYNEQRESIGQPIIEEYFYPEFKGGKRRESWLTPDSLKSRFIHRSKYYNTDKGNLIYEADYYVITIDSVYYVIRREYYFNIDSLSHELKIENGNIVTRSIITRQQADSLIDSWQEYIVN